MWGNRFESYCSSLLNITYYLEILFLEIFLVSLQLICFTWLFQRISWDGFISSLILVKKIIKYSLLPIIWILTSSFVISVLLWLTIFTLLFKSYFLIILLIYFSWVLIQINYIVYLTALCSGFDPLGRDIRKNFFIHDSFYDHHFIVDVLVCLRLLSEWSNTGSILEKYLGILIKGPLKIISYLFKYNSFLYKDIRIYLFYFVIGGVWIGGLTVISLYVYSGAAMLPGLPFLMMTRRKQSFVGRCPKTWNILKGNRHIAWMPCPSITSWHAIIWHPSDRFGVLVASRYCPTTYSWTAWHAPSILGQADLRGFTFTVIPNRLFYPLKKKPVNTLNITSYFVSQIILLDLKREWELWEKKNK